MLVLYFIIGTYLYKKGKFKDPEYKPFLEAHINDGEENNYSMNAK